MITKDAKLIQPKTVVVGVDIAKRVHWATVMYEGMPVGKAFAIRNTREGFENLLFTLNALKQKLGAHSIVVGMEPTGHYFKPLAYFLANTGMCQVVLVNPYHVNRSKEFDDNSPTKNDRKDARVIARLVSQGNYFFAPLNYGVWAELRNSNAERLQLIKKRWQLKNQLTTILDQFFPEFADVFKDILGKGAIYILTHYPFPADILEVEEQTLCEELKEATTNRVGQKRARKLREAASHSIGIKEGLKGARNQVYHLVEQLELIQRQIKDVEIKMAEQIEETGAKEGRLKSEGKQFWSAQRQDNRQQTGQAVTTATDVPDSAGISGQKPRDEELLQIPDHKAREPTGRKASINSGSSQDDQGNASGMQKTRVLRWKQSRQRTPRRQIAGCIRQKSHSGSKRVSKDSSIRAANG